MDAVCSLKVHGVTIANPPACVKCGAMCAVCSLSILCYTFFRARLTRVTARHGQRPFMRHSLRHNRFGHSGIRHRLRVHEGGTYRASHRVMKGGNSTEGGVGEFQSRAALRAVDLGGALSRHAFEVPNRARSSTHHTAVVKNTPHASDAMSASVSMVALVKDVGERESSYIVT